MRAVFLGGGSLAVNTARALLKRGHEVVLIELDKKVIDRRMAQMRAEGISFHANTHVGVDLPAGRLLEEFDAWLAKHEVAAGDQDHDHGRYVSLGIYYYEKPEHEEDPS